MNTCSYCKYWHDFMSYYEDPQEPDDFGHCLCKEQKRDATACDFTCEYFEHYDNELLKEAIEK